MRTTRRERGRPTRTVAVATTAALTAGLLGGLSVPAGAAVPEPDLHYTMAEIDGETVPDASGNGLDGTISGTTAQISTADGGTALELPGGNGGGYVTLPRGALEDTADLTVSVRLRWAGTGGSWQWLYALGSNNQRYLFTTPSNADGRLRTAVTTAGGGGEDLITGHGALPAGEWVTLTTTLDTDAEQLTTYLDGVEVAAMSTTTSADDLLTAGATSAGYLGRSFYADPMLRADVDDFRIYHSALSADQVAELVGDDLPTLTGLASDVLELRTTLGNTPELPDAVRGTFSDGYDRDVAVDWDDVDPGEFDRSGVVEVAGTAAGADITARVTVTRGELRIDAGTDTGPIHGGAAGLLYGLYADGMPSDNLVEGMNVRTVATKGQDGAQHPGSDALEVVQQLADTTGGDVYVRTTDWYRGFPYQWPGDTPEERLADYWEVLADQLAMVQQLEDPYRDHIVIEPFNEPEGNMFGTGEWSYDGTSWLNDPTDYFAAWDHSYAMIREALPDTRISGPNTSILYDQVYGFLEHAVGAGTLPDIISWHELSHPQGIRDSVVKYREWEAEIFAGTEYEGTELPININEYAFNYHTSVPGQMIQWISAIEESKVDAMIAFWNINGNLSDSAVGANRGNGQWWLFNTYAALSGHTVDVTPPFPGENYTLQGVAALDEEHAVLRAILGGADGTAPVDIVNLPTDLFGDEARVWVREIPWTGQLGDSPQPRHVAELVLPVVDGALSLDFDGEQLPLLEEASAYELVVMPAGSGTSTSASPALWEGSYEAEDAAYSGSSYSVNGPEGSPADVGKFYTSGGYDVGGMRTGSDLQLDFEVTVPQDGSYDLKVFANSLNTYELIEEQGPTNVFLTVDGEQEQEVFLPLGYKWVVWDHAGTTVELTEGTHTISLAAQSLDGSGVTIGDALIDRITLALPNPEADATVYEAELANLDGGTTVVEEADSAGVAAAADGVSGSGAVELADGETATFWVYSAEEGESTLTADVVGSGEGTLTVNGRQVLDLAEAQEAAVYLSGGVNKVTVTGAGGGVLLDRLVVAPGQDALAVAEYQAEDAMLAGEAEVAEYSLAEGGQAVTNVGGEPGNENTLTFIVDAEEEGPHAVTFRYSNPEQVPGTHYNPNPLGRHADIAVNGGASERVMFPPTFHENNFWERTVVLELSAGENSILLASEELPNFDGVTYAEDNWPGILLRAQHAPIVDRISVAPFTAVLATDDPGEEPTDPGEDPTDPGEEPTDPGIDPVDPGADPTGPGRPGADGPGATAPGADPDGALPSTGAPIRTALMIATLLLTAGALMLRRRAVS
ncbi:LamG-like jellyroll fold domain-containing protein [Georgenia sp. MJ173]|uniref:LamG-like jellyroll fold domain-containing protein n=1 Tax=Georgenia sunbinii TaxID=3117728 RepID=UPI002F26A22A